MNATETKTENAAATETIAATATKNAAANATPQSHVTDALFDRVIATQNPTVVGLDTKPEHLPEEVQRRLSTPGEAAAAIEAFNRSLIDALCDVVPAVKVQAACYEMLGLAGMRAFAATLAYAAEKGLCVIADVKRGDIGSTAACYAAAYLGERAKGCDFACDWVTVNPYLGVDGIAPFTAYAPRRGVFCLVRTSNPSGAQLQSRVLADGQPVYGYMGTLVDEWGSPFIGKYGYSAVGAVVGATHPAEGARLRKQLPHTPFLVPGYGAQGGTAEGVAVCFDARGLGAVVNNSRGILTAYRTPQFASASPAEGARKAAIQMKRDIALALERRGVSAIGG